jgi:4-aminobutyrate aminotransferase-like enzyme/Ser/Thr protein kinase RdoA (MazF antagonist)/murein DD-endopeptidase MepM/ murein hydrolase activator NlpD
VGAPSNDWLIHHADAVRDLLYGAYGIESTLTPLVGEYDLNLRATSPDGDYLCKVMRPGCDPALVEMQCAALEHLATRAPDLPLQRLIRTRDGSHWTVLTADDGTERLFWVLTYLPGRTLVETRPHTYTLLAELGQALGQVDATLADFSHPACTRELKWDLRRATWIAPRVNAISDPARRSIVARIVEDFEHRISPALEELSQQAIYGDANDHNLLVDYDPHGAQRLAGILDFGDMCFTPKVCEVAIAVAYAMMGESDPVAAAAAVVAGYHSALPLSDTELTLVFPLALTRLAVSVVNSALSQQERPDDPYITVSEAPAWALLERLHRHDPALAEARLRAACQLDPWPQGTRIMARLHSRCGDFAPVLGPALPASAGAILDISFTSTLGGDDPAANAAEHALRVEAAMRESGRPLGLGRYGEPRPIYSGPAFALGAGLLAPHRTRHLGVDLFAPAGTPVHAPLAGEVILAHTYPDPGDYGGLVILRHRTDQGDEFRALYGHLAPQSIAGLHPGDPVVAGSAFAVLGAPAENGGWPPHLHLQVLMTGASQGDDSPPGVAPPDAFAAYAALAPNPAALLNLDDAATAWHGADTVVLWERRTQRFAANLKPSYRDPLQTVRGFRHFLYDPEGRTYLDAYNNVPHVGHCHPRVVEAVTRQLHLLNTNTRYLYAALTDYADRLVALLPAPLSVCFFVNSGSEANELALRLARAHTGARDMLVMDHGYHGNTTGAMDISPYKFNRPGGPGVPDWVHVTPLPDTYRGAYREDTPDAGAKYAAEAAEAVAYVQMRGRRVAGYISECVPSVGGQIVLPPGFLRGVYHAVRAAGGVCIADDVQTGLGRMGSHFWGFALQDVIPDILVLGKPSGNGYPLGAVITTPEIAASFASGPEFFSTFGGSTVSCAAGIAVLDVLAQEQLQHHADRVGRELLAGLRRIMARHPLVGDVRGSGLFLGIELVTDRETRIPATSHADYVKNRMRDRRVLLGTEGPHDNVLKIRPPMTFDSEAASALLDVLDEVLSEDLAQPDAR